ncbi:MAG: hypothetical protein DMG57_04695 [Acidobacteria bacterium]|nr:MAG: hypothetical protein DMG57_04695 [Acidobacteriota bacterium]
MFSYQYFRDHNHVFSGLTGVQHPRLRVRAQGLEPETVVGGRVIGNFFQMLGVKPAIGRLIGPGDAANSAVAVVSWSYWRNKFNLDPAIVGRRIGGRCAGDCRRGDSARVLWITGRGPAGHLGTNGRRVGPNAVARTVAARCFD